jgi:hypothetical protein
MLTKDQLDYLWSIEVACQRSIRAAKYFDAVSHSKTTVWSFTQNCYGAVCIIHWCQVFGAYSEPTHYSKLFAQGMVAQMTKETVADRVRASIGMNKSQYRSFWKGVTAARNQYFVHYEFGAKDKPTFPDIDLLLTMCVEMRDIVREILQQETSPETNQLENIMHFTSHHSNAKYLSDIQGGAKTLEHAVTSRQR